MKKRIGQNNEKKGVDEGCFPTVVQPLMLAVMPIHHQGTRIKVS